MRGCQLRHSGTSPSLPYRIPQGKGGVGAYDGGNHS